ncbi:MAG: hypothetical protein KBH06_12300 [Spirochaetes bacterium]|nr:hypothetical protein [Spirochaetota bacterium]
MRKIINIISLVLNSLYLLYSIFEQIILFSSTNRIGTIGLFGGADGPTAIYVIPFVLGLLKVFIVLFFEIVFIINLKSHEPK